MQSSDSLHGFGYTFWTFWIIALHLLYKLWISNILDSSITEGTCIVEMRIWCRTIGTIIVIKPFSADFNHSFLCCTVIPLFQFRGMVGIPLTYLAPSNSVCMCLFLYKVVARFINVHHTISSQGIIIYVPFMSGHGFRVESTCFTRIAAPGDTMASVMFLRMQSTDESHPISRNHTIKER